MVLVRGRRLCITCYSDLSGLALAIRKKTVKGLCGKRTVKHGMISKLTGHVFPSIQPQLAPVLENRLQVHTCINACQKNQSVMAVV